MGGPYPEDIERLVTETLLRDKKDMFPTMTRVASRFNTWSKPLLCSALTKPIQYRAVTINARRLHALDILLPHIGYIQTLALHLHEVKFFYDKPEDYWKEKEVAPPELAKIELLLKLCSSNIRHLAVPWDVWANLPQACGSLHLSSLYLIWDGRYYVSEPSLECLEHPEILKDLVVSAPSDLSNINCFRSWGNLYLDTDYLRSTDGSPSKVGSLEQLTYVSLLLPSLLDRALGYVPSLKSLVFVQLELIDGDEEDSGNEERIGGHTLYRVEIHTADHFLREWVAKCDGRENLWNKLGVDEGNPKNSALGFICEP